MQIPKFKIRCSSIGEIMGESRGSSITEKQLEELKGLEEKRENKPLTAKQAERLEELIYKRDAPPELSSGAKTYCQNWLKDQIFGRVEVTSKYLEKGVECEAEAIAYLNPNFEKNESLFESEYITGTPDVITTEFVLDVKCPWDHTTFDIFSKSIPEPDYFWQLQGYCALTGMEKAILAYVLMTTPNEINPYGLSYDHLPRNLRVKTYEFYQSDDAYFKIVERVEMCREYIETLKQELGL